MLLATIPDLKSIIRGEIRNERHQLFEGNKKKLLTQKNEKLNLVIFSDDRIGNVMEKMRKIVTFELTNYATDVLFPECCIRIVMYLHGLSYEAAENLLSF